MLELRYDIPGVVAFIKSNAAALDPLIDAMSVLVGWGAKDEVEALSREVGKPWQQVDYTRLVSARLAWARNRKDEKALFDMVGEGKRLQEIVQALAEMGATLELQAIASDPKVAPQVRAYSTRLLSDQRRRDTATSLWRTDAR